MSRSASREVRRCSSTSRRSGYLRGHSRSGRRPFKLAGRGKCPKRNGLLAGPRSCKGARPPHPRPGALSVRSSRLFTQLDHLSVATTWRLRECPRPNAEWAALQLAANHFRSLATNDECLPPHGTRTRQGQLGGRCWISPPAPRQGCPPSSAPDRRRPSNRFLMPSGVSAEELPAP